MNPRSQDTSISNSNHELEKIINAISKITSLPPAEIKPQLEKFLLELSQNPTILKNHFFATATDDEWIFAFSEWSKSHEEKKLPVLSETAMSRESMYPDRW